MVLVVQETIKCKYMDREIKVGPKMEKRLAYLGFEEKNTNVENIPEYRITVRYFIHPSKLQLRVNTRYKELTFLDKYGYPIISKEMFLTSEVKKLIKEAKDE